MVFNPLFHIIGPENRQRAGILQVLIRYPLRVFSFKKELGFDLKDKKKKIERLGISNCYVCSILKRWILNKKAKQLGFDVICTAHSLNDEAETILLNILKGNPELLGKLGPYTGSRDAKEFIKRVKPFYLCSTKEIILYAKIKKIPLPKDSICPMRGKTFRVEIRDWLSKLEKNHTEVKNAIISSFLKIMPLLKQKYKSLDFKKCKKCGYASSQDYCRFCILMKELR